MLPLPGRFHGDLGQGATDDRTVAWAKGRSGRQGDPGASEFFLSLEDDLMRLFGSERIANVMEMNNFEARKRLLDYDDVMNQQREVMSRPEGHGVWT